MALNTLNFSCGQDVDFTVTLKDAKGNPFTDFVTDDTPSATVWVGSDETSLFTPTVAWIDPTAGTVLLSFLAVDTATVKPGKYRARVSITRASDSRVFSPPDFWVNLSASPGSSSPSPSYVVLEDLLPYASWLLDLLSDEDTARLEIHCALSRQWLEGIIQSCNRLGNFSGYNVLDWSNNIAATPFGFSKYLQDQLIANKLMIDPPRLVKPICAYRTLSTYLYSKINPMEKENQFQKMSRTFERKADEWVKIYKAEIDYNGDGYADYIIDCGRMTVRSY
jgi:hypothetical protein